MNERYVKLKNKDLNSAGKNNFCDQLKANSLILCLSKCESGQSCVMVRFQEKNCMLFNSVQISNLVNFTGSYLYTKKSLSK